MAVLAATTLLSLLVRGGVERNLEPDIERTLDRLYGRTDSRLFQTEGQITLMSMEVRDVGARLAT